MQSTLPREWKDKPHFSKMANDEVPKSHSSIETSKNNSKCLSQLCWSLENSQRCTTTKRMLNQEKPIFEIIVKLCGIFTHPCPTHPCKDRGFGLERVAAQFPAPSFKSEENVICRLLCTSLLICLGDSWRIDVRCWCLSLFYLTQNFSGGWGWGKHC